MVSIISLVLLVVLYFSLLKTPTNDSYSSPTEQKLFAEYSHAAVVTNAPPCATIAKSAFIFIPPSNIYKNIWPLVWHFCDIFRREILQKGGKAVDAMISSLLCDGVTMPHTLGIGGGFFMNIYDKKKGKVTTITARETAPAKSTVDMYHGNADLSLKGRFQMTDDESMQHI